MHYMQMVIEYFLVYCTSHGLTAIGEPALSKTYQPVGESLEQCSRSSQDPNPDCKQAMPVWIISIFLVLATSKWMASFLMWYLYLVLSTVNIVASKPITIFSALNATGHEDSHRARLERLARQIRVVRAFTRGISSTSSPRPIRTGSVVEVRQELKRRATENIPLPLPIGKPPPPQTLWSHLTSQPCFRGFAAYLTMQVPQWYLSQLIDLLLSGLPPHHKLGYGSTSIVLTTAFGGGFAVWTHYCITRPSNKRIFAHFPKGHEVLTELWPVTAFWAVCEHVPNSIPLAVSRVFGLRAVAFDALAWNGLSAWEREVKVGQFAGVWVLHVVLVAGVAIPATMILRRFYASMLSEEDLAIVPFHRGDKKRRYDYAERGRLQRPGLTVSEAWGTVTGRQYLRVVGVYAGWVVVNQVVQMVYWWSNWELHKVLEVERFASTKLPCSPVGMIMPAVRGNGTGTGFGGRWSGIRSEI